MWIGSVMFLRCTRPRSLNVSPSSPPGKPVGRLGDDHVARVRAAAKAGGDIQRGAAEAPVLEGHRLAGVDADPDPQRKLVVEIRLLVEPRLQVDGAPDRLARGREDGERLVAADLHDLAAVQLHVLGDHLDELGGQTGRGLGPELVGVPRVAPDVRDQERVDARLAGVHGLQYGPAFAPIRTGDRTAARDTPPISVRPAWRPLRSFDAPTYQQLAKDHLWMHFTRMGGYRDQDVPMIVRGDGCYLEDANGKRYLDALAGLFSVNIGYSFGEEIGQAALEQMRELPFYTNWTYAHPRAIELAARGRLARAGRPEPRLLRLGRLRGGRVGLEARAPVLRCAGREAATRRDARAGEPPRRDRRRDARNPALQGDHAPASPTTGRRSARSRITGIPALRTPFEPLLPEVRHVRNTNRYHRPLEETEEEFTAGLLDELEQTIVAMGPETVCLVHMEPVQNAGGAFTPPAGYWRACGRSATGTTSSCPPTR